MVSHLTKIIRNPFNCCKLIRAQHVTVRLRQSPSFWPCLLAVAALDASQLVANAAFPVVELAPPRDVDVQSAVDQLQLQAEREAVSSNVVFCAVFFQANETK